MSVCWTVGVREWGYVTRNWGGGGVGGRVVRLRESGI